MTKFYSLAQTARNHRLCSCWSLPARWLQAPTFSMHLFPLVGQLSLWGSCYRAWWRDLTRWTSSHSQLAAWTGGKFFPWSWFSAWDFDSYASYLVVEVMPKYLPRCPTLPHPLLRERFLGCSESAFSFVFFLFESAFALLESMLGELGSPCMRTWSKTAREKLSYYALLDNFGKIAFSLKTI